MLVVRSCKIVKQVFIVGSPHVGAPLVGALALIGVNDNQTKR